MPLQSLLVKISICDTNGVSFSMHFRYKKNGKKKKKKKAISRTAIIPMFPFKIAVVFESPLLKEKPQLKFINTGQ